MEPIYHFATPQSIEQLKAEQVSREIEESANASTSTTCCKQASEKNTNTTLTALALAFMLISFLFGGPTVLAQANQHHAMAYRAILPTGKNIPTAAIKSLDDIRFPEAEFKPGAYLKMRTVYLQVPVEKFKLKPFPANSSAETRAELDFLLYLQSNRTTEGTDRSETMANIYFDPLTTNASDADYNRNLNSLFYIGRDLGPWFNPAQLPITTQVLQHVLQDATYYFFSLKADFNRPRPYHLEPRLQNLEAPGHASYPSGHSSASHVHAYLLGHIFPEYADHFMGVASDMAFSRETRGVHYPSDSEAGKEFARQFVEELMKNRKFRADFAAMKAEIKQARATSQLANR